MSAQYDSEPDSLTVYLREIGGVALLTHEEEIALAKRIAKGDRDAHETMIRANLRLVPSIAKRYVNRGLDMLDLISEGNIGLMTAVRRYDWRRGTRFSTHATWWIRQAITRAVSDKGKAIRMPVYMHTMYSRIRHARSHLVSQLGRDPNDGEMAAMLGVSEEVVRLCINATVAPLSLETEQFNDNDNDVTLADYIESDYMTPEEQVLDGTMSQHIKKVLAVLNDRERLVIGLRYGLFDGKARSLEETGKDARLAVTRERIRQIEVAALRKLRAPDIAAKLQEVG